MKHAAALLLTLLLAACAAAVTTEYAPEEQAKCDAQGGCHVITLRSLEQFYRKAFDAGLAAGVAQRCGV